MLCLRELGLRFFTVCIRFQMHMFFLFPAVPKIRQPEIGSATFSRADSQIVHPQQGKFQNARSRPWCSYDLIIFD